MIEMETTMVFPWANYRSTTTSSSKNNSKNKIIKVRQF